MSVRIIGEVGSTHMGKVSYAKEAIDRALIAGFDAIKFQLFPNIPKFTECGNIWLDPEKYLEIAEYAAENHMDCSASVFDEESFDFLIRTSPKFIKFAFSQKDKSGLIEECVLEEIEPIVSCDIMSVNAISPDATTLFCLPHYPVYFEINFDRIFPRFDGFSDHSLGYEQTIKAIEAGAKVIEKHISLVKPDILCPDSFFALPSNEWGSFINALRRNE